MLYRRVLKPVFFLFDPEDIHNFMTDCGEFMGRYSWIKKLIGVVCGYRSNDKEKVVDGITYKTPFVLAAGFDYNGRLTGILESIGLGGEEIGSITARPCEGNSRPRLKRLPVNGGIIVNKGLKNEGVDAIIRRLKSRPIPKGFVVGFSIARTNDRKAVDANVGIEDYVYSFKRLNEEAMGDYYTLNISCPNSFTGETFASPNLLGKLLSAIDAIPCGKPIYVKMPINPPWEKFKELLDVCDRHRINGVVIGNLNKDYSHLKERSEAPGGYCGGLSGEPARQLSTELIRKTRALYGKRFTIIGAGGVMSIEAAREKFEAGADLIQLITGLIYEGPGLVRKMCRNI